MANEKRVFVKILSKRGVLKYPHLQVADTKFSAEGVFRTKIRLNRAENADLIAQIDAMADETLAATNADAVATKKRDAKTGKPVVYERHLPYQIDFDDDGEDSGFILLTVKSKKKPVLVDSRGVDITTRCPPIWSGTVAKILGSLSPCIVQGSKLAGVTAFLNQAMIIDLKTSGMSETMEPETDGFSIEEISHVEPSPSEQSTEVGKDEDY